ncbi:uncharacterized protein EKO05_0002060 [Ascochyta rabiei]|uniref:uncharacterized protein n=1 Tax=Didymella rabiei TaxID=5454 RepID=UPI0022047CD2|nr:uncharacterized protein EKO05_0002060 [Ascochyta rabiei]UPX11454.1 hypothetical protein EKO05_0002060 [Ascochyta rabiei]
MPTSLAAVITLFASSAAVMDFRGTSSMSNRERERYLADLDCRYGYGSFVGSDGAVHVGIEKVPFVRYVEDVEFKERVARRRKGSPGGNGKEVRYAELDRSEDGDRRAREEAHRGGEERRGEEEGRSPSSLEDIPLAADDELR